MLTVLAAAGVYGSVFAAAFAITSLYLYFRG